jgi:hypothetical protein
VLSVLVDGAGAAIELSQLVLPNLVCKIISGVLTVLVVLTTEMWDYSRAKLVGVCIALTKFLERKGPMPQYLR